MVAINFDSGARHWCIAATNKEATCEAVVVVIVVVNGDFDFVAAGGSISMSELGTVGNFAAFGFAITKVDFVSDGIVADDAKIDCGIAGIIYYCCDFLLFDPINIEDAVNI